MDVALAVLYWTLSLSVALATLMLVGYLSAITDLIRAKIQTEKRLH